MKDKDINTTPSETNPYWATKEKLYLTVCMYIHICIVIYKHINIQIYYVSCLGSRWVYRTLIKVSHSLQGHDYHHKLVVYMY